MAQNKSIQVMACKIKRTVDSPWEIAVMVYGLQQNSAIDQQGKPIPAPIHDFVDLPTEGCMMVQL